MRRDDKNHPTHGQELIIEKSMEKIKDELSERDKAFYEAGKIVGEVKGFNNGLKIAVISIAILSFLFLILLTFETH